MHIHYLQHVSFEDPAHLLMWAENRRFSMRGTRLDRPFSLPSVESIDALIIMGGPMGVYDESQFPWIKAEKRFIESVIHSEKKVIGICLGAQFIADVLGARVYKSREREIGWFSVQFSEAGNQIPVIKDFPKSLMAFHWHGDTFDLPREATLLGSSDACQNQAFIYNHQIIGLQFHLEGTRESIKRLIDHCGEDLKPGRYIQSAEEIGRHTPLWEQSSWRYCDILMDWWAGNQEENHA
jgi:GMP synthase-like glutamine amidotransferase